MPNAQPPARRGCHTFVSHVDVPKLQHSKLGRRNRLPHKCQNPIPSDEAKLVEERNAEAESSTPSPSGDHERLQGFWKLVGATMNGQPFQHENLGTLYEFKNHRFRHIRSRISYRFELHPEMNPKGFDLILVSTQGVSRGLYELDGDSLRIVRGNNWNKNRPASLDVAGHWVESYIRFRRKVAVKRRVKAQILTTMVPGSFIPKGLLDDLR